MPEYNPYDILTIKINGKSTYGRPVEFDSIASKSDSTKNIFGYYIKPSKIVTTCPDCGQGIDFNVKYPDPPFPVQEHECYICAAKKTNMVNPFISPFAGGRVKVEDLNPNIYRADAETIDTTTVAERIAKKALGANKSKKSSKSKKTQEKAKEKVENIHETANALDFKVYEEKRKLEPAEGMDGIEEFDDKDFIDP